MATQISQNQKTEEKEKRAEIEKAATNKIILARLKLQRAWDRMNAVLMSLPDILSWRIDTMAVDLKGRIYYNPQFVLDHTLEELMGVFAHEVLHVVLRHGKRAHVLGPNPSNHTRKVWNIAADLAINSYLKENGFALPEEGCFPKDFDLPEDLTTEQYYSELLKQCKETEQLVLIKVSGDAIDGDQVLGSSGSGSDGQKRDWEHDLSDRPLSKDDDGDGDAKGGGKGDGEGDKEVAAGSDAPPDVDVPDGLDSFDRDVITDLGIKAIGTGSGGDFKSVAESRLPLRSNPVADFRRMVKMLMQSAAKSGHEIPSYARPPRRRSHPSIIRPRYMDVDVRVAVVIDSSGSMSGEDLSRALTLVQQTLASGMSSDGVQVYSGDTQICSSQKVFRPDQVEIKGGGGTRLWPLVDHAINDKSFRPSFVVLITDGYDCWHSWPEVAPRLPVVCCVTTEDYPKEYLPDYVKAYTI